MMIIIISVKPCFHWQIVCVHSYEDVMWQPGMWEAIVKMEFIREIYWIMDRQRDRKKECSFVRTEKGQVLYKIKSSLNVLSCVQQFTDWELKETNLLDSVILLRDHVVGHHGESYKFYKGPKVNVSTNA